MWWVLFWTVYAITVVTSFLWLIYDIRNPEEKYWCSRRAFLVTSIVFVVPVINTGLLLSVIWSHIDEKYWEAFVDWWKKPVRFDFDRRN